MRIVYAMKRQRLIISCGPETVRDITEIAHWTALDSAPNVSDTLRRLIRWAVCNPDVIKKGLGCPYKSPLEYQEKSESKLTVKATDNNPPIVLEPTPPKDPNDTWGDMPE